jgi:hypothetical protein
MRDAESMLDQVLVSSADPVTSASISGLLGLADARAVDGFIDALVDGDVLGGIGILDDLESEGRDLVAFSEQLVTRLRELLVARMSGSSADQRAKARPLADVARRLTGMDASRSGLGGYRWQLELCLLGAADADEARRAVPSDAPDGSSRRAPSPPQPAPPAGSMALPTPSAASPPDPPATAPGPSTPRPSPSGADRPTVGPLAGDDLAAIRAAWAQIVATIGRNPANRPLVSTCRPVEMRDGFLVLGFPEDQAFMRDIAERKRLILEDGIAAVLGRPVAVRCVVTNLELVEPVDSGEGDLVAQAKRIFDGELVGVEDID